MPDDWWCRNADGTIDNLAQTDKIAGEVAQALGEDIDYCDPVFCAGVVIIVGNALRFRFGQVSDFTGLPRRFCQRVIQNLGHNRLVFKMSLSGELAVEMERPDGDDGVMNMLFALYCLAGAGQIRHEKERWYSIPAKDVQFYTIADVR